MERLTGLDATFLYLENPSMHMHVAMVAVFDPSSVEGGYSFDKVRALIERRLPRIPLFRRRLAQVPFNLHHPVWMEDPDFDLDYHLRRVAVPAPGGIHQLCDLAGDYTSRQLDRARPLWEMQIVEGLENGFVGTMAKVHHCTVDGVSGADMMVHLFDLEPNPAEDEEETDETPTERVPTDLELVAYAARSRARRPFQVAQAVTETVRTVSNFVRTRRGSQGPGMPTPFTAPRTNFNAAITPHRSVALANLALDDVKAIKNAAGCTVNDVVLALCSGALRRYLDRRGELPDTSLMATVPVSVRQEVEGEGAGANAVSAMFTSLATDVADPRERLETISSVTKGAKEEHKAIGASMLQDWTEFAAPRVFSRASAFYSRMNLADRHPPIHNLVISNVPGPPFPLYFAGARLVMLCPLGPVMEGAGLNVTVLSYLDSIDVGLHACRELMPDLWNLADDFGDAMSELKKAVEPAATAKPAPKKAPAKKANRATKKKTTAAKS